MLEKLIYASRTTEVNAVGTRMIGAYQSSELGTDAHLTEMFNSLTALSAKLTTAINRSKAESTLEEYDAKRDDNVRSLLYLLNGLLHHPDENIQNAAEAVKSVFDKYGLGIIGESYATESSLVASLLEDLSAPDLQESIALLPVCAEIIAALQTAQDQFETVRIAYEKEKGEESIKESATAIKKEVVNLVNNKIVVYLRAMETVDEPVYGNFTRTVAEIIDDNNEVVKRRRSKTEPVENDN